MRRLKLSGNFARMIAPAVVAGCLCINIAVLIWALVERPALNSDFRGPWSFANFARHQTVARIYQSAPLQAYQHQLYPGFRSFFPYQYPPSFLLPIWWIGNFSYPVAQALWSLAGLAALVTAGWMLFGPSLRWFAIAALLGAPASLLNGVAGETGYFTAAVLLAGFAWLPMQPMLAGIAFGLLTLKPQLGVLIPIALLARRDYLAMLSAGLTALALAALPCAVFPGGLWADWLRQILVLRAQYQAAGKSLDLNAAVTIAANLTRIGAAPTMALGLQALISLASAAAVFFVFRRAPYRLGVAALCAGSFLSAPHAYAYDTIPVTAAMLLLQPASAVLITICLTTYLAPYLLLTEAGPWFLYAFPETLLFISIIYLALTSGQHPNIRHEPVLAAKFDPSHH